MERDEVAELLTLGIDAAEIHVITSQNVQKFGFGLLERVLSKIGTDSQADQGLPRPVTSLAYVRQGHDLVVLTRNKRIQAFCKLGVKHLFQYLNAEPKELCALCILDIFVYEQRSGVGTLLISVLQQLYGVDFGDMAVDRPSAKMSGFLAKKWGVYNAQQNSQFAMRDAAIARLSEAFRRVKFQASRGGRPFDYMQLSIQQYAQFFGGRTPEKQRYILTELLPQAQQAALSTDQPERQQTEPELERSIVEEYLQAKHGRAEGLREDRGELASANCRQKCGRNEYRQEILWKNDLMKEVTSLKDPQQPPVSRSSIRVRQQQKTGFW